MAAPRASTAARDACAPTSARSSNAASSVSLGSAPAINPTTPHHPPPSKGAPWSSMRHSPVVTLPTSGARPAHHQRRGRSELTKEIPASLTSGDVCVPSARTRTVLLSSPKAEANTGLAACSTTTSSASAPSEFQHRTQREVHHAAQSERGEVVRVVWW